MWVGLHLESQFAPWNFYHEKPCCIIAVPICTVTMDVETTLTWWLMFLKKTLKHDVHEARSEVISSILWVLSGYVDIDVQTDIKNTDVLRKLRSCWISMCMTTCVLYLTFEWWVRRSVIGAKGLGIDCFELHLVATHTCVSNFFFFFFNICETFVISHWWRFVLLCWPTSLTINALSVSSIGFYVWFSLGRLDQN